MHGKIQLPNLTPSVNLLASLTVVLAWKIVRFDDPIVSFFSLLPASNCHQLFWMYEQSPNRMTSISVFEMMLITQKSNLFLEGKKLISEED